MNPLSKQERKELNRANAQKVELFFNTFNEDYAFTGYLNSANDSIPSTSAQLGKTAEAKEQFLAGLAMSERAGWIEVVSINDEEPDLAVCLVMTSYHPDNYRAGRKTSTLDIMPEYIGEPVCKLHGKLGPDATTCDECENNLARAEMLGEDSYYIAGYDEYL